MVIPPQTSPPQIAHPALQASQCDAQMSIHLYQTGSIIP